LSIVALLPGFDAISQPTAMAGVAMGCMITLAVALILLASQTEQSDYTDLTSSVHLIDILQPTSLRAFALITLYIALFTVPLPLSQIWVLLLVVLRLAQVLSIFHLVSLLMTPWGSS
jgi:hypothetical protein